MGYSDILIVEWLPQLWSCSFFTTTLSGRTPLFSFYRWTRSEKRRFRPLWHFLLNLPLEFMRQGVSTCQYRNQGAGNISKVQRITQVQVSCESFVNMYIFKMTALGDLGGFLRIMWLSAYLTLQTTTELKLVLQRYLFPKELRELWGERILSYPLPSYQLTRIFGNGHFS